jgi:hypothetical protein
MEFVLVVIVMGFIVPILLTKAMERSQFKWLEPRLREAWTLVFCFLTVYLLQSENMLRGGAMLHEYTKNRPWLGYVVCAVLGAIILCGYWWFTGTISSAAKPESQAARDVRLEQNVQEWLSTYGKVEKLNDPECYFNFNVQSLSKKQITVLRKKDFAQLIQVAARVSWPPDIDDKINRLPEIKKKDLFNELGIELVKAKIQFNMKISEHYILVVQNVTISDSLDSDTILKALSDVDGALIIIQTRMSIALHL